MTAVRIWRYADASRGMLKIHCEQVEQALRQLEQQFGKRGEREASIDRLGRACGDARFALSELKLQFAARSLRAPERQHARAYLALVERCTSTLAAETHAIDERYSATAPETDAANTPSTPESLDDTEPPT